MKIFIKFDENGNQIEATNLEFKPDGDAWKLAPKDFDFCKRYRLLENGNIQEIPESELILTKFDTSKALVSLELSRIIDIKRSKFIAINDAKRKSYEIQENAAKAIIADENDQLGNFIKPLADLRKISVLEMSQLILKNVEIANQKIMELESIEDEFELKIEVAKNESELDLLMSDLSSRLEDF